MSDLIKILESFNRKERFFLIAQALGNQNFELSTGFREKLGDEVGVHIPERDVFVAMDYHLNWVHASLVLAHHAEESDDGEIIGLCDEGVKLLNNGAIVKSQQDIDLLVAFRAGGIYRLIFVEAKGYDTTGLADFSSGDQLELKAEQLEQILNPNDPAYSDVKAYYCLLTGKQRTAASPEWEHWLELALPEKRLVVHYNASIREVCKGAQSRQIIPPRGQE